MNVNIKLVYCILATVLVAQVSSAEPPIALEQDAAGFARVVSTSIGTQGGPILIFEEIHTSRAGQIEQAIVLSRRYSRGLRDICLEGYLASDPKIDTAWFREASKGLRAADSVKVAVKLLKEGEISSVEFMALAYPDIRIHPAEVAAEYNVSLDDKSASAPLMYLMTMAQSLLRAEHLTKIQELQKQISRLNGDAQIEKQRELVNFILSVDPWLKKKGEELMGEPDVAVGGQLMLVQEIAERPAKLGVAIDADLNASMRRSIAFWNGRVKADKTMSKRAGEVVDMPGVKSCALVVGAAHTDGITRAFKNSQRTFAVIRPRSLDLKRGTDSSELSLKMFERKGELRSVYSDGFMSWIEAAYPAKQKKTQPVLSQEWLRCKSEIYLFTKKIAAAALGNPRRKPPYGFSEADLKTARISIDPGAIEMVKADEAEPGKEAVLFPVKIASERGNLREIWIKAALDRDSVDKNEKESVEAILMAAHAEVADKEGGRIGDEEQSKKVEDAQGRIRIDLNTLAVVGLSSAQVKKTGV